MKFNFSNLKLKKSTWYLISGMFLWALYWGYTAYNFVLSEKIKSVDYFNEGCQESIKKCAEYKVGEVSRMMEYELQIILAEVVLALIIFWCFFITFKYLYKFIKVGFLNEFRWVGVSLLKKTAIVLLGLFNVLVILFLYFTLDDYQKSAYVSVIPNTSLMVSKIPHENPKYINAQGTWRNIDKYSESTGYPNIQSSKIRCLKSENTCYEAIASANKQYMHVDLIDYPIINWNDDSVTYGEEGLCRKDLHTINVSTKSVSRSFEYLQTAGCDTSLKNKYSQMVDGYDVYVEERKKLDSLITKFIKLVLNI